MIVGCACFEITMRMEGGNVPKESLNLSVESASIERGRRYSQLHSTSISKLVDDFLSSLPVETDVGEGEISPNIQALIGIGKAEIDEEDYHRYLLEKYGR